MNSLNIVSDRDS